jgi:hypothetical protein
MAHRTDTDWIVVEAVRAACLGAAIQAYDDAGIRGLCADGRWEAALAAIRQLDLSAVLEPPAGSVFPARAPSL